MSSTPSALPTITGAVSAVSISGAVTSDLPADNVADITTELADIYGVDPADVETTVAYTASGTLDVSIPEGVSETEVIESLQDSISDVLGVHPKDVIVSIDDDGVVTYSVTGATYAEAEVLQNIASEPNFAAQVTEDLEENGSTVVVESSTTDEEIDVVITATVDTTDATGTEDPTVAIADLTSEYGLTESNVESIIFMTLYFELNEDNHLFISLLRCVVKNFH